MDEASVEYVRMVIRQLRRKLEPDPKNLTIHHPHPERLVLASIAF